MNPRIETSSSRQMAGMHMQMSLSENKTGLLWASFMHKLKEIGNRVGATLYSVQVYDVLPDFTHFDPTVLFEKWAVTEVTDDENLPNGMEPFLLEGGLYAVFLHIGGPSTGARTFQYIFGTWLPNSEFVLDHRPHFEVLGEKYSNNDPESEEEIWIPIRFR
jgi:AraC family transcriptional regulator